MCISNGVLKDEFLELVYELLKHYGISNGVLKAYTGPCHQVVVLSAVHLQWSIESIKPDVSAPTSLVTDISYGVLKDYSHAEDCYDHHEQDASPMEY